MQPPAVCCCALSADCNGATHFQWAPTRAATLVGQCDSALIHGPPLMHGFAGFLITTMAP